MAIINKISIEQYLEKVGRFSDSEYGKLIRNQRIRQADKKPVQGH